MIIKADQEGIKVLEQLADIALKYGGLANLRAVNELWQKVEPITDDRPDNQPS